MTGTIWALHKVHTLMDNNIQMLTEKIEVMSENTALQNTHEETPKIATRTLQVDTTTFPSPQTMDG